MKTHRKEEMAALLQREISQLILKTLPEDMGIITVTDVLVTADFKLAKIHISVLNSEKEKEALELLENHALEFQRYLGKILKMKFTPKLEYTLDHYQEKLDRVDELLEKIDHGT